MILESTQLLCTAHHLSPNKMGYKPPYKLTHKNHPSALWTRESVSNYKWLCKLGKELCIEYTYRYNKEHKSEKYIDELMNNVPDIEDIPLMINYFNTYFEETYGREELKFKDLDMNKIFMYYAHAYAGYNNINEKIKEWLDENLTSDTDTETTEVPKWDNGKEEGEIID